MTKEGGSDGMTTTAAADLTKRWLDMLAGTPITVSAGANLVVERAVDLVLLRAEDRRKVLSHGGGGGPRDQSQGFGAVLWRSQWQRSLPLGGTADAKVGRRRRCPLNCGGRSTGAHLGRLTQVRKKGCEPSGGGRQNAASTRSLRLGPLVCPSASRNGNTPSRWDCRCRRWSLPDCVTPCRAALSDKAR